MLSQPFPRRRRMVNVVNGVIVVEAAADPQFGILAGQFPRRTSNCGHVE